MVSLGTLAHIQHKNEKNRCTWECGVAYFNFFHPLCPTILTEILVPPSPTNLRAGGVMLYLVPPRLHGGVWSCYTLYLVCTGDLEGGGQTFALQLQKLVITYDLPPCTC